jgi:hypothetical protein
MFPGVLFGTYACSFAGDDKNVCPGIAGEFFLKHSAKKPCTRDFTKIPRWLKGNNTSFFRTGSKTDTVLVNSPAVYKPEYYLYYLKKPPWYWEPPAEGTTLCTPR